MTLKLKPLSSHAKDLKKFKENATRMKISFFGITFYRYYDYVCMMFKYVTAIKCYIAKTR